MAREMPDKLPALEYFDEDQLREWAIAVGNMEGRSGWPEKTVSSIGNMSKNELIRFLARNYYKGVGH